MVDFLEGFYRSTDNQIEYRNFADLFLNPHLETELIQGEGLAFGTELMIQKTAEGLQAGLPTPSAGLLSGPLQNFRKSKSIKEIGLQPILTNPTTFPW